MKTVITCTLVALGLLLPGSVVAEPLKGEALKQHLTDGRSYCPARGGLIQVDYKADGTLLGSHQAGASDGGKWWIEDETYCRQWNQWADGAKACFDMSVAEGRIMAKNRSTGQAFDCKFEK